MANNTITHALMCLSNMCIFSVTHIKTFLHLATLDNTSAQSEAILKQQNHQ